VPSSEAGSISSGESFFTLPTSLPTFQAVILSAGADDLSMILAQTMTGSSPYGHGPFSGH
jgi:hypothetical protein